MGDPRKQRKKYNTPLHPWQGQRILEEHELVKTYGLRNKKEVWKAASFVRRLNAHAKRFVRERMIPQSQKEEKEFFHRFVRLGILPEHATIESALSVSLHDVLARRLQTQVVKKGFAATHKQARQFIVHGHIQVNGVKMTSPSYVLTLTDAIAFVPRSSLAHEDHPERVKKREMKSTKQEVNKTSDESEFVEFKVSEEEARQLEADVV